jgi:hypothetical protein
MRKEKDYSALSSPCMGIRKSQMTDQEMLEELKNWDEESWKLFKQKNYETIPLSFQVESPKDCMEQSDHD